MRLIELNIQEILRLCVKYSVRSLDVFGSILTDRFKDDSDVDFAVSFQKDKIELEDYADNFFNLQFDLEELFHRPIDLVCYDSISNPVFRRELDNTKVRIYG